MTDEQQYLTAEGADELRRELDDLLTNKRPALAANLKEAISQGDLSENADYIDAKEQQAFLEGRIKYLETLLRSAIIVDEDSNAKKGPLEVHVGYEVTIKAEDEDESETYRIVGAAEADPRNGKISNESPMGAALMGHRKGDVVRVESPGGEWKVKIVNISR